MPLHGLALALALALGLLAGIGPAGPKATAAEGFRGKVEPLSPTAKERIRRHSWRPGCPVPLRKLRSVRVSHWSFKGRMRQGRLIVHRSYAREVMLAFRRLHAKRFRIRRIRPIDAYGGDDRRSMGDDNTSAFNCRFVAGTSRWSTHAYGKAIDINPRENPYVTPSGHVSPPEGRSFVKRKPVRKGMIAKGGVVVRVFRRIVGWRWGGNWSGTKDYQHFSHNGR